MARRKAKKWARMLRGFQELAIRCWAWIALTAHDLALRVVRRLRKRAGALWGWLDEIDSRLDESWDDD